MCIRVVKRETRSSQCKGLYLTFSWGGVEPPPSIFVRGGRLPKKIPTPMGEVVFFASMTLAIYHGLDEVITSPIASQTKSFGFIRHTENFGRFCDVSATLLKKIKLSFRLTARSGGGRRPPGLCRGVIGRRCARTKKSFVSSYSNAETQCTENLRLLHII